MYLMYYLVPFLNLDNKNVGAWKILGEIYLAQNNINKANDCLKKVYELSRAQGVREASNAAAA